MVLDMIYPVLVVDWDAETGSAPPELADSENLVTLARARAGESAVPPILAARAISDKLPVTLRTGKVRMADIPTGVIALTDSYIRKFEDTTDFIAGRIDAAVRRYAENVLPPFFGAMVEFAQTHEYSWPPGHTGGTAFLKAPVGNAFPSLRRRERVVGRRLPGETCPFRRGVVRPRALQPPLPRSARDDRPAEGRSDGGGDPFHAQAAGRAFAGIDDSHQESVAGGLSTSISSTRVS